MLVAKKIPFVYIVKSIRWDIFNVFVLSVITYFLFQYIDLPDMPIAIPTLLGTAISLVLSFKLSHSYDRWWEARKIWGAIVNDSRTLIVQLKNFVKNGKKDSVVLKIGKRQIAWNYALGQSLRALPVLEGQQGHFEQSELNAMQASKNIPLTIMDLQSGDIIKLLEEEKINHFQHIQLDNTIVRLIASMGQAERIKKTVFPTAYRIFLHFFIYIFVGMLAISMAETVGVWEIPRLMLITLPFFMLEKTAFYLQDPFENRATDTPVTAIARTVEVNIMQLLEMDGIPETRPGDNKYFVL